MGVRAVRFGGSFLRGLAWHFARVLHRTQGVSDRKTAQTDGQAHGLKEWGEAANLWRAGWGRSSMRGEFVASNSRQPAPARPGLAAPPARARAKHPPDTTPEMKPWCSATRRRPELPPFPRQVAIADGNLPQPGDLKALPAGRA